MIPLSAVRSFFVVVFLPLSVKSRSTSHTHHESLRFPQRAVHAAFPGKCDSLAWRRTCSQTRYVIHIHTQTAIATKLTFNKQTPQPPTQQPQATPQQQPKPPQQQTYTAATQRQKPDPTAKPPTARRPRPPSTPAWAPAACRCSPRRRARRPTTRSGKT